MPSAQVITFHAIAPHGAPKITRGSTIAASTIPVPIVVASATLRRHEIDVPLMHVVISNLLDLVGPLPDVLALGC